MRVCVERERERWYLRPVGRVSAFLSSLPSLCACAYIHLSFVHKNKSYLSCILYLVIMFPKMSFVSLFRRRVLKRLLGARVSRSEPSTNDSIFLRNSV